MNALTPRGRYAADLLAARVRLPLRISPECSATIIDADGRDVATIDMNRERPDAEAVQITLWIILAVNTCGGYSAAAADIVSDFMLLHGHGTSTPLMPPREGNAL